MEHETKASSSGGRHGSHKHKKKKQMPLALKIILLAVLVLLLAGAVWGLHFYQEITSPESLFEPQTPPAPPRWKPRLRLPLRLRRSPRPALPPTQTRSCAAKRIWTL